MHVEQRWKSTSPKVLNFQALFALPYNLSSFILDKINWFCSPHFVVSNQTNVHLNMHTVFTNFFYCLIIKLFYIKRKQKLFELNVSVSRKYFQIRTLPLENKSKLKSGLLFGANSLQIYHAFLFVYKSFVVNSQYN